MNDVHPTPAGRNMRGRLLSLALLAGAFPLTAVAGTIPERTLIVINDASKASLELGQYYQEQRRIPERNLCHVFLSTNALIDSATFSNELRNPVLAYISSAGLSNQVDYIVLSRDIPYRVQHGASANNRNGTTSAMYYDYRTSFYCDLRPDARNDYFGAEKSFSHASSPSSNRYYIVALLTGEDMEHERTMIDRAIEAEGTRPTGSVYLLHSTDTSRSIRWPQFEDTAFLSRLHGTNPAVVIRDADSLSGVTGVVGVAIGRGSPAGIANNQYVPGALADHLTSCGGWLFDSTNAACGPSGQTSILAWIAAGCVGSYGTVMEPCTFLEKFPWTRLHYWYARGFSMGESYMMAVQHPYQGVVVGDPLCAPYAVHPSIALSGLVSNQAVTGTVSLALTAEASSTQQSVDSVELYLDGLYLSTLTNLSPEAGNLIAVSLNGTNVSYEASSNETLEQVAEGLASGINSSNLGVVAIAAPDRILLVQGTLGEPGAHITYGVSTATGTAGRLTLFAEALGTNFMETIFPARQVLYLDGAPRSGDVVTLVITNLAGLSFTNSAVATATNDTAATLMSDLAAAVNADPGLQDTSGCAVRYLRTFTGTNLVESYLVARTNHFSSYHLYARLSASNQAGSTLTGAYDGLFLSNADVMSARGMLLLREGMPALSLDQEFSTIELPDGPHLLTAVVYDGSAVRAAGSVSVPFRVDNHSLDCQIVAPQDGAYTPYGSVLSVSAEASLPGGTVTLLQFFAESRLFASTNGAAGTFQLTTADYGPGQVGLQVKAFGDGGEETVSDLSTLRVYTDDDGDGLPNGWEWEHFQSFGEQNGTNDADGDLVSNLDEFLADTDPWDNSSVFAVDHLTGPDTNAGPSIRFVSSSARAYEVEAATAGLLPGSEWNPVSTNRFRGEDGYTTWADTLAALTNDMQFYRARSYLP